LPDRSLDITRRTLFESGALSVGHVVARPSSPDCGEIERQASNILVFPLAGVFAKHEGPRRHVVATPSHAVLLAAGAPYRIGYPGAIGDECLALRFSSAAADIPPPDGSLTLLSPAVMLARALLWRRLASGLWDRLEVEELGVGLVVATLRDLRRDARGRGATGWIRPRRAIEQVLEAISLHPERKWSLDRLAELTGVSPWHLARMFREETGAPIHRYLLRARLLKALDAVLGGGCELSHIALAAGFASHSHFTARFRALFGLTPAELRRRASSRRAGELRKIVTAGGMRAGHAGLSR
jgi:AraC-like DNA-binding protein